MNSFGNYQKVYDAKGIMCRNGTRSNKRIKMIKWNRIAERRVLDIGCNAGLLSLHSARIGAKYVLGIDLDECIKTASDMARNENLTNVEFKKMDIIL